MSKAGLECAAAEEAAGVSDKVGLWSLENRHCEVYENNNIDSGRMLTTTRMNDAMKEPQRFNVPQSRYKHPCLPCLTHINLDRAGRNDVLTPLSIPSQDVRNATLPLLLIRNQHTKHRSRVMGPNPMPGFVGQSAGYASLMSARSTWLI